MNLFEKTLSSETVYKGSIFNVEKLAVLLPDGNTSSRDVIRHNGGIGILAQKDNGKFILVEQFRKPIDSVLLEIPAGKLEKGEDPKECAFRELEEETGYKANHIEFLGKIVMAPGFADEYIHLYYATNLSKGIIGGDDDEFINVHEFYLDEINDLINEGKIFDSKTISGIKMYENLKKIKEKITYKNKSPHTILISGGIDL